MPEDGAAKASVDAGHGVLLTPNHCRMCDPLVLGEVAKQLRISYYAMVSWHAFQQDLFHGAHASPDGWI